MPHSRMIPFLTAATLVASMPASANILPVASHFCLPDVIGCLATPLMSWTASSEQAGYYKTVTPLASRLKFVKQAGDMVPQYGFDDSNTAAQFEFGRWVPQETNWQYLQQMVYFGGSQSGGQVLAPTPGWIRAAHQNGVKISGSIFFSPIPYGGDKELKAFADMVTPGKQQTAIAKQLAAIADTYGFDGWFINQEVSGMSADQMKGMQSFIHQLHLADPKLIITWYDDSDTWTFLDNSINPILLDPHSDKTIYNPVFINYGWSGPAQYVAAADKINYPISDIQYGVEVPGIAMNGWTSQKSYFDQVMPNPDKAYGALVEWDYMTLITRTGDGSVPDGTTLNDLNGNERALWTNGGNQGEAGASQRLPWFTAVTALPFTTAFNTGEGQDYYIDGVAQHVGKWHDIGQQELLPSWQFDVKPSSSAVQATVQYAYDTAYNGASSLHIHLATMKAGDDVRIPLYRTNFTLKDGMQLEAVSKQSDTRFKASLCLESQQQWKCYSLPQAADWKAATSALSTLIGQEVDEVDLDIKATGVLNSSNLYLGQLYIGGSAQHYHGMITPTTVKQCHPGIDCLGWQSKSDAINYRIFDQDNHFVGATHQTVIAVPSNVGSKSVYHVQAVMADNEV